MARLKDEYNKTIKKELLKEGFENVESVPKLLKVVINTGVGDATTVKGAIEEATEVIADIAGQKPKVSKSKLAVSSFKLREDMEIGVSVTLRGDRMWEFTDKLVSVVLPRVKDFRGISPKAFDGQGNYSLGIEEHTVFPEIDANKNQKLRGLQVTFVTSAQNDKDARLLLDKFGFPFKKDGKEV
jgi:large subunit ribosomal protein L5